VTLIGKGRQNRTYFVYSVCAVNRIIFFFTRCFVGVVLDLDKYIWPWQKCFLVGLRVIMHLGKYGSRYSG